MNVDPRSRPLATQSDDDGGGSRESLDNLDRG
jgi:hypothetical protein